MKPLSLTQVQNYVGAQRYTLIDKDLIYQIIDMWAESNDWVELLFKTEGHPPQNVIFQTVDELVSGLEPNDHAMFPVTAIYLTLQDCRAVAEDYMGNEWEAIMWLFGDHKISTRRALSLLLDASEHQTHPHTLLVSANRNISVVGIKLRFPITVQLFTNNIMPQTVLNDIPEDIASKIPDSLWTKDKDDVGLRTSVCPVKIQLKPNCQLPRIRQYPMSAEAYHGIGHTMRRLEKQGVIYKTSSPCNIPILPIKKGKTGEWRMVQDLRPINQIVQAEFPVVTNPATVLSNIPPTATHFTVNDLSAAFFSIPFHEESQFLFAFSYGKLQYIYSRLPQGYCESPSVFNRIKAQDLANLPLKSTLIQYVDLLLCSDSEQDCQEDTLLLKF